MSENTRWETDDRYMSSWVVAAEHDGVLFFLTSEGLGTDILSRAGVYRWNDQAEKVAYAARGEYAWRGFAWESMMIPEAMNRRVR